MSRARSWLALPQGSDARETLEWVRRMEIAAGVVGIIIAATTWSGEWWSWLILGGSVLNLSPWPGVRMVLKKAETNPAVLTDDADERKERGRRFLRFFAPFFVVTVAVIGYLLEGVGGAIFFAAMAGVSAAGGAWMLSKMEP